jgi:hypothetical protein
MWLFDFFERQQNHESIARVSSARDSAHGSFWD